MATEAGIGFQVSVGYVFLGCLVFITRVLLMVADDLRPCPGMASLHYFTMGREQTTGTNLILRIFKGINTNY